MGLLNKLFASRIEQAVQDRMEQLGEGLFTVEDRHWEKLGADDNDELAPEKRKTIRERAWASYRLNPLAKRQINATVSFLVGKGLRINVDGENADKAQEVINEFRRTQKFDLRLRGLLKRTLVEGESFPVLFASHADGTCKLRQIRPTEITDIAVNPDDYDDVAAYKRSYTRRTINPENNTETSKQVTEWMPPEEVLPGDDGETAVTTRRVLHWTVNVVEGMLRGESDLQSHLYHLGEYNRLLKSRAALNKARANFAWILTLQGADSKQVAAMREKMQAKGAPPPSSIFVTNERQTLDAKGLNVGAGDAADDLRSLRLMIVAGSGLPEFLVTGDASNANYASSAIALQAFKKTIEEFQDLLQDWLQELFSAVLSYARKHGDLSEDYLPSISVEFPVLVLSDLQKVVAALSNANASGFVSKATASARLGFDYAIEKDRIAEEEQEDLEASGGISAHHAPEE